MKRLVLLSLFLAPAAFAQESSSADSPEPAETVDGRKIVYAKETEVLFDGMRVDGVLQGPNGVYVSEPQHKPGKRFIQLRDNFDDEMSESVDAVR
jgi:hypothetical protein